MGWRMVKRAEAEEAALEAVHPVEVVPLGGAAPPIKARTTPSPMT